MTTELSEEIAERLISVLAKGRDMRVEAPDDWDFYVTQPTLSSGLMLLEAHGLAWAELDDEDFKQWALNVRGAMLDSIAEEHWKILKDGAFPWAFAILSVYVAWAREECFPLFAEQYQVKTVSRMTQARWALYQEAWATATADSRRGVWDEYFRLLTEDPTMAPDWAILLSLSYWVNVEEVPFVSVPERPSHAKPQGKDGKEHSI